MTTPVPLPIPIPNDTPPISDVEKLILQDLFSERAKLRKSIRDSLRPMGVALAAIIGFLLSTASGATAPPSTATPQVKLTSDVFWHALLAQCTLSTKGLWLAIFLMLLVGGFWLKIRWLQNSLEATTDLIKERVKPWSKEDVNNKDMVEGNRLGDYLLSPPKWAFVVLAFVLFPATVVLVINYILLVGK
jgi:hypothetical protein